MPHAVVKLMAGKSENQKIRRAKEQKSKRSKEQKSQLAEEITKDLMSVLNYGEQSVSVAFEEINPQDWTEKVYKPDIQNKWDTLYKKPGYDPF